MMTSELTAKLETLSDNASATSELLSELDVLAMFDGTPDCPRRIVGEFEDRCWFYSMPSDDPMDDEIVFDEEEFARAERWCAEFWHHFDALVTDGVLVEWLGHFHLPK